MFQGNEDGPQKSISFSRRQSFIFSCEVKRRKKPVEQVHAKRRSRGGGTADLDCGNQSSGSEYIWNGANTDWKAKLCAMYDQHHHHHHHHHIRYWEPFIIRIISKGVWPIGKVEPNPLPYLHPPYGIIMAVRAWVRLCLLRIFKGTLPRIIMWDALMNRAHYRSLSLSHSCTFGSTFCSRILLRRQTCTHSFIHTTKAGFPPFLNLLARKGRHSLSYYLGCWLNLGPPKTPPA